MAEHYNAHDLVVTDDQVSVAGRATPIAELARAEEYQLENWGRNLVIFVIGCLAPIAAMILFVQIGLIQTLRPYGMIAFGVVITTTVVVLGGIAALIGLYWPKPWGVVVERKEVGFDPLCKTPGKDEAQRAAAAINKAIGA